MVLKMLKISLKSFLLSSLFKILYFVGGIAIGILLVMIIYLLTTIIYKHRKNKSKIKVEKQIPETNPNLIIERYQNIYTENYGKKNIKIRLASIKDISINLVKDIAKVYYPSSKEAMLEVSLENLILLSHDSISKIDNLINDIIADKRFKILWFGYRTTHNISNFFKKLFNKNYSDNVSVDIRDMKISYVLGEIDKIKENASKKKSDVDPEVEKSYFFIDKFINKKICELINEIGKEAILVYSGEFNGNNTTSIEVIK